MRVIVTARGTLTPNFERILGRLVGILAVISKNPSNPQFDQYTFESLSGLMRSGLFISELLRVDQTNSQIYRCYLSSNVADIRAGFVPTFHNHPSTRY